MGQSGGTAKAASPRTVKDELTSLAKRGATDVALASCEVFADAILAGLMCSKPLSAEDRAALLRHLLTSVTDRARKQAFAERAQYRSAAASNRVSCLVAGAGELLRLTNEDDFGAIKDYLCKKKGKDWEEILHQRDHHSELRYAQLRASVWIGDLSYKSATASRHGSAMLRALAMKTYKYVRKNRAELSAWIAENLELSDIRLPIIPTKPSKHLAITDSYVHRLDVEAELRTAVEQAPAVVLHGESGVGKSTLAKKFATEQVPPELILVVRMSDSDEMLGDALDELERFGVPLNACPGEEKASVKNALRKLLESRGPRYAIFVNVTDIDLLTRVLPEQPTSKILITANRKLKVGAKNTEYVSVGSMYTDEARALMRLLVPDIDERLVYRLDCLYGRPFAIEHICAVLAPMSESARAEYSTILIRNVVAVLGLSTTESKEPDLWTTYSQLIEELESQNKTRHGVDLLRFLMAASWEDLKPDVITRYMSRDVDLGQLVMRSAISVLKQFRILTSSDETRYTINPLTRAVLEDILKPHLREDRRRILRVIAPQIRAKVEIWRNIAKCQAIDYDRLPEPLRGVGSVERLYIQYFNERLRLILAAVEKVCSDDDLSNYEFDELYGRARSLDRLVGDFENMTPLHRGLTYSSRSIPGTRIRGRRLVPVGHGTAGLTPTLHGHDASPTGSWGGTSVAR